MTAARTLLIADDHPLVRDALRMVLKQSWPSIEVREAETAAAAEHILCTGFIPDLICLDLEMPGGDGLSALARIRRSAPKSRIAILSGRSDREAIETSRALGANAYCVKTLPMIDVAKCLKRVMSGESVFPALPAPDAEAAESRQRIASLTPAQLRVLLALKSGKSNRELASDLGLTEVTVKTHLSAGFKKLQVTTRSQAILLAQNHI